MKSFWKTNKNHRRSRKKQVDALKNLKPNTQEITIENMIPEDILNQEAKNELNKTVEIETEKIYKK